MIFIILLLTNIALGVLFLLLSVFGLDRDERWAGLLFLAHSIATAMALTIPAIEYIRSLM